MVFHRTDHDEDVSREHREYRKRERTTAVSTAQDPAWQLTTLLGPLVDGRRSLIVSTRVRGLT